MNTVTKAELIAEIATEIERLRDLDAKLEMNPVDAWEYRAARRSVESILGSMPLLRGLLLSAKDETP